MTRWRDIVGIVGVAVLWLAVMLALWAVPMRPPRIAQAQPMGECKAAQLQQDGVIIGCIDDVFNLAKADFACFTTATGVTCNAVRPFGSCIGEPADFCGTFDLTGVSVTLPNITGNVAIAGTVAVTGSLTATGNIQANGAITAQTGIANLIGTLGFLEFETAATNTPNINPALRIFHRAGTITGAATLNLDFPLAAGTPFVAPCPSGQSCMVQAWIQCHCTGGSSCTANQSAAAAALWVFRNNGGTITQIGTAQTTMNQFGLQNDGNIGTLTPSLVAPNWRFAILGSANYNNSCVGTFWASAVG